jgi:ornithine carbamoyltransferase
MNHFVSLLDVSSNDLKSILDRADELAARWERNEMPRLLEGRQVCLWFHGQGFRNRVAFEIGARAMGASVTYMPGELGVNEPLEDVGSYLENWFSLLVVRAKKHADLCTLARSVSIPVINARTDLGHPCEIMGDLQFIRRQRGRLDDLRVVFVGEVTNLGMSWFEASNRFPIAVTQVAPEKYLATEDLRRTMARDAVGEFRTTADLDTAMRTADVIYTDCWPKGSTKEQAREIGELFTPYQITADRLAVAPETAVFLPCPPVTRGQEVSSDAMRSKRCMNSIAKDCLLHAQNAILEFAAGSR